MLPSLKSPKKASTPLRRRAHPSVFADAMAKQHEKLPEVHASQILDVWDTTEDPIFFLMGGNITRCWETF